MGKDENITLNRKSYTHLHLPGKKLDMVEAIFQANTEDMLSVDMGCVGADLGCTERMVSICERILAVPYNYDLITELHDICKEYNIDYTIDVYPHYGSDVETTLRAGYDIRHGLIGPGVYASHNYERSHVDGVMHTFTLLQHFITK